jgi:putative ABC transport system ATP-binding protein
MTLLALERVRKGYWRGRHEVVVLDDVSCEVSPGEFVAVFGQRASGKTTLLRIAAGIEQPDAGAVRFGGRDVATRRPSPRIAGLDPRIGWLRRSGPLIASMQMLDYVALPLLGTLRHREAHRCATRVLKDVGAKDLARATWSELSDAERTLVMLAQATVRRPLLLLADDPTVSLGLEERTSILTLLRATADANGMAVLMTVPDVPDMLHAHHVMALADGELIRAAPRPRGQVIELRKGHRGGSG